MVRRTAPTSNLTLAYPTLIIGVLMVTMDSTVQTGIAAGKFILLRSIEAENAFPLLSISILI